jgi:endonuclease/exonuclease/phosphatase family metal-dependent hydrolase
VAARASAGVRVIPWRGLDGRDRLEAWRANVGDPVSLDLARPAEGTVTSLAVLSWNLWIGRGRLADVVARVRSATDAPLLLLVQEAFRADDSVPVRPTGRAARRAAGAYRPRLHPRLDIVELAHELELNLRYVPSMRNGAGRSDRGNAILSELPLEEAYGVELPLLLQRRVPLAAAVGLQDGPLHVVSAHLDPRGPPGAAWLGSAGRAAQTAHLLDHLHGDLVVLGADLNLGRGRREPSWRLLGDAEFATGVPPVVPHWRHTFHAMPRLVLDYLLMRDRGGRIVRARVERMDEHPTDRGPLVFGSDHHPLLARIELLPPERRP